MANSWNPYSRTWWEKPHDPKDSCEAVLVHAVHCLITTVLAESAPVEFSSLPRPGPGEGNNSYQNRQKTTGIIKASVIPGVIFWTLAGQGRLGSMGLQFPVTFITPRRQFDKWSSCHLPLHRISVPGFHVALRASVPAFWRRRTVLGREGVLPHRAGHQQLRHRGRGRRREPQGEVGDAVIAAPY
eukprot:gene14012-biopygen1477